MYQCVSTLHRLYLASLKIWICFTIYLIAFLNHVLKGKSPKNSSSSDKLIVLATYAKPKVSITKMSYVQVSNYEARPPIGELKPNSLLAILINSWNEGWFDNDTGKSTTDVFFSIYYVFTEVPFRQAHPLILQLPDLVNYLICKECI
jgi:hypothetical protein